MKGIRSLSKGPVKNRETSQQSSQAPGQLKIKGKLVLSAQWGGCILREQGKLVTVELLQSECQLACTLVGILVKASQSLILGLHVDVILDLWRYLWTFSKSYLSLQEMAKNGAGGPPPAVHGHGLLKRGLSGCRMHPRWVRGRWGGHRFIWVFWHRPF